jgi:predicted YcjX-like family ATPase
MSDTVFGAPIRLGVTGLARSGKTVFITTLIANLLIDILDYPGEWLLDLGLMDKSYEEWSKDVLHRMANRSFGADYVNALPAKLPPSRRWCQSHGLICWWPLAQTSE